MSKFREEKVIAFMIIIFWWLFWLFNVIDKFIAEPTFLWAGRDRLTQFTDYFATIRIEDPNIAYIFFIIVTLIEIIALILMTIALIRFLIRKNSSKTLFWGIVVSMFVFTIFGVGDQVFGDRKELWEHTTFWMALLLSWFAYKKLH